MEKGTVELRVPMDEESLQEFIARARESLLNPDDWWFLAMTLRHTGEDFIRGSCLHFDWEGRSEPQRCKNRKFSESIILNNLQAITPHSSGKPSETVKIREENFYPVVRIANQFLEQGYKIVYLRARTGTKNPNSSGILLEISSPGFGSREHRVEMISKNYGPEGFSSALERAVCLLESMGFKRG